MPGILSPALQCPLDSHARRVALATTPPFSPRSPTSLVVPALPIVIPAQAGIQRGGALPPQTPIATPTSSRRRRGASRSARPAAAGPSPSHNQRSPTPTPPSSFPRKRESKASALHESVRPEPVEACPEGTRRGPSRPSGTLTPATCSACRPALPHRRSRESGNPGQGQARGVSVSCRTALPHARHSFAGRIPAGRGGGRLRPPSRPLHPVEGAHRESVRPELVEGSPRSRDPHSMRKAAP